MRGLWGGELVWRASPRALSQIAVNCMAFLALFDGTGFLVQEIGGVFGILVIWDVPRRNIFLSICESNYLFHIVYAK